MGAYSSPVVRTFKADAAISKGELVKFGTDEEHVAVGAANTDKIIGIALEDAAAAEDLVEIAVAGGALALAGETISAGDSVVSHTDGSAYKANADGDQAIGIAFDDAVSGDLFAVQIDRHRAHAADE